MSDLKLDKDSTEFLEGVDNQFVSEAYRQRSEPLRQEAKAGSASAAVMLERADLIFQFRDVIVSQERDIMDVAATSIKMECPEIVFTLLAIPEIAKKMQKVFLYVAGDAFARGYLHRRDEEEK